MNLIPGNRPVPNSSDYKLIRKLGSGGFGEVWHANGPGGLDIALKFIQLSPSVIVAEIRSLEVMKSIRHPNLVSIFGAWQKDNWLILAMELCDCSLQDRLAEAIENNLPGIPIPQLLDYMSDTANGLDALNAKQVQHRDIKPANLLMLDSGVKVADFGLAKALEHTIASNSGAGTIAYIAPECFRGQLAKQSDQYSLAATYYHLRTGELLFKGNQAQVMYGHLELKPDLSKLWPGEDKILAKALEKKPGQRWNNCKTFVKELTKTMNDLVMNITKARNEAREEEHRRIVSVLGYAWGLASRMWPEIAQHIHETRFIRIPKESRAVLAIRPSTGTLGIAVGAKFIAPDYLWHELVHMQQFTEGRLPPINERTREQFIEIEREAWARQGQMRRSGTFEKLASKFENDEIGNVRQPNNLYKGIYPPNGIEPLEYDASEWEMLTSVMPGDEEVQPLPD